MALSRRAIAGRIPVFGRDPQPSHIGDRVSGAAGGHPTTVTAAARAAKAFPGPRRAATLANVINS
jgi:hypothetical protein